MHKLCFIQNTTDPYWVEFYEYLNAETDFDLFIIFIKNKKADAPKWTMANGTFNSRYIHDGSHPAGILSDGNSFHAILRELKNYQPDVIFLNGYDSLWKLLILLWARTHKVPVILQSDSNIIHEFPKGYWHKTLKRIYVKYFINNARAILCMGIQNRLYWQYY